LPKPSVSPSVLPVLAGMDAQKGETVTAVLYEDRRILAVEPGDTSGRVFGAAVDLGTTTVVVEIIDLSDGRTMAASAGLNGQARFGADVVSRITAAHFDPEKLSGLRDAARRTINGLLAGAFHEAGIRPPDCYEIVVAGNTVMSHLFLGLPVATLAEAPFRALFSSLEPLEAAACGLDMNAAGRIYLARTSKASSEAISRPDWPRWTSRTDRSGSSSSIWEPTARSSSRTAPGWWRHRRRPGPLSRAWGSAAA